MQQTTFGGTMWADSFVEYEPVAEDAVFSVTLRSQGAGTVVFTPALVVDLAAIALTPGAPVTVRIAQPGQHAALTVPAVTGRALTLTVSQVQLTPPSTQDTSFPEGFALYARQGTGFWTAVRPIGEGMYRGQEPASTDEPWTVKIDLVRDVVGSLDVDSVDLTDSTTPLAFDTPTDVVLPSALTRARLTFTPPRWASASGCR